MERRTFVGTLAAASAFLFPKVLADSSEEKRRSPFDLTDLAFKTLKEHFGNGFEWIDSYGKRLMVRGKHQYILSICGDSLSCHTSELERGRVNETMPLIAGKNNNQTWKMVMDHIDHCEV